jgi:hypothetical protein
MPIIPLDSKTSSTPAESRDTGKDGSGTDRTPAGFTTPQQEPHPSEVKGSEPGATPPGQPEEQRPSFIPEKFKTGEEFAKGYSELESEVGRLRAELAALKSEKGGTTAGPDWAALESKMQSELDSKGEISKETRQAVAAHIPEKYVDRYIEAQRDAAKAIGQRNELYLKERWGENAGEIGEWIKSLPSDKQKEIYGKLMSKDMQQLELATDEITALYQVRNGYRGKLMHGQSGTPMEEAYESEDDPEYLADTQEMLRRPNDKKIQQKIDRKLQAMLNNRARTRT